MSEPMDEQCLVEIDRRANAARPGPWEHTEYQFPCEDGQGPEYDLVFKWREDGTVLADFFDATEADVIFLAHAREDVPNLVAEVRRAQAGEVEARTENERLRVALGQYADENNWLLGDGALEWNGWAGDDERDPMCYARSALHRHLAAPQKNHTSHEPGDE